MVMNVNISRSVIDILIDSSSSHRDFICMNKGLPQEYHIMIARKSCGNQYSLAANENISEDAQDILIEEDDVRLNLSLAINPNLSAKNQIILAKHENYPVKIRLKRNQNLCNEAKRILDQ